MKLLIQKTLGALGGVLGGSLGWAAQLIIPKIIGIFSNWIILWMREIELKKKDAELLKLYNEAVASEGLSREQRRKMAERLLNRDL